MSGDVSAIYKAIPLAAEFSPRERGCFSVHFAFVFGALSFPRVSGDVSFT